MQLSFILTFNMRLLELYSGIGGMHYAVLESEIDAEVVAAVDINTVANSLYRFNFPKTKLLQRNIQSISASEVNDLSIDMITMSPPCQPFTRLGLKKDVEDRRCDSLTHIINLLPLLNHNFKYLLVENVKGFEFSEARNQLVSTLTNMDFIFQEFILSPSQFAIPNTRHRYYLIAKRKPLRFCFEPEGLMEDFPFHLEEGPSSCSAQKKMYKINEKHRSLVKPGERCYRLDSVLIDSCHDRRQYPWLFLSEKILRNKVLLCDIVNPTSQRSCCFTRAYTRLVEGTGSVICPFSEKEMKKVFEESQNYPVSEECVTSLLQLNLRYFAPREIARLMCFPENKFCIPETVSQKQLYRLLGNSINVHVVALLMILLLSENE